MKRAILGLIVCALTGCNGFLGLTLFERTGIITARKGNPQAPIVNVKTAGGEVVTLDPLITDLIIKIVTSPEAMDALVKLIGDPGSIAALKATTPIDVKVKTTILKFSIGGGEEQQKIKEEKKIEVKEK